MSRLPLAESKDLPPFLSELHDSAPGQDWSTRHTARVFSANPQLLQDYLTFYYPWHRSNGVGLLEPRLKELVRLRIATLNGCKTCKAARLDPTVTEDEAMQGVDDPSDAFTDRERAAIVLAEQMAVDHFSIDEDTIRELKTLFDDGEILELMMMAGQYIGFGRMLAVLQLEEVSCPL